MIHDRYESNYRTGLGRATAAAMNFVDEGWSMVSSQHADVMRNGRKTLSSYSSLSLAVESMRQSNGDVLRTARMKRSLTTDEFAADLRVDKEDYRLYESGKRLPPLRVIQECNAFHDTATTASHAGLRQR